MDARLNYDAYNGRAVVPAVAAIFSFSGDASVSGAPNLSDATSPFGGEVVLDESGRRAFVWTLTFAEAFSLNAEMFETAVDDQLGIADAESVLQPRLASIDDSSVLFVEIWNGNRNDAPHAGIELEIRGGAISE